MAESILRRRGAQLGHEGRELIQRFRLAGLLHDIGHYPFSHATQDAVKIFGAKTGADSYVHENLGSKILEFDQEIQEALNDGGIEREAIAAIFERTSPTETLTNIVASDLDADRLDYLPRTSHSSGLPFGSVDRDYLISQLCEDDEGKPCLTFKGLRAADAFLISRLMDYRQVAFHKTVAAFEWLLKDVIVALLGLPDCDLDVSKKGIVDMIKDRRWPDFTDANVEARIDAELTSKRRFADPVVAQKAEAIIKRYSPAMVGEIEQFVALLEPGQQVNDGYLLAIQSIETAVERWSREFKIDKNLWHVWRRRIGLTKMGARISVSTAFKEARSEEREDYEQLIRLTKPKGKSKLLIDMPQALCHLLADYNLEIIRVYVLLPPDKESERANIETRIRTDVPAAGWTG